MSVGSEGTYDPSVGGSAAAQYFAHKAGERAPREKVEKRVSLYADQNGGLANPSKSKKRKQNYGTGMGGGEHRAKW
jgi:hypothetical protein